MEKNKIHFEKTWCDYLTPCPFRNKEQDPAGVFVGDWDYCHDGIANHNWEDGNTYEEAYPSLVAKYTERRETFLPVIKNALKTVEGLGEIWSVDFILDNDKVWLIDMARGKQSAYWDDKKIYGINNCK